MKIRAAVLRESGAAMPYAASKPIKIETLELDEPQQGEVLVKMKTASLCHSDLSVINGSRPRPLPMALGHEAAGEVVKTGEGVTDLAPGDHVVCVFVPSCGECLPCKEGRPALCETGAASNAAALYQEAASGCMQMVKTSCTISAYPLFQNMLLCPVVL